MTAAQPRTPITPQAWPARTGFTGCLGPFRVVPAAAAGGDAQIAPLDNRGRVTAAFNFTPVESVACFTPGTSIATPKGGVPVEDLAPGDRVITRDNGLQDIVWAGRRHLDWKQLAANAHIRPILVTRGSLGDGLPEADMMVSPNHRMLVANGRTALHFTEPEVLVAAKHLVNHRDVRQIESLGTTYIHVMLKRHEVLLADGLWTESFQPVDASLKGVGNAQRQELLELFPALAGPDGTAAFPAARRTLTAPEAALLGR